MCELKYLLFASGPEVANGGGDFSREQKGALESSSPRKTEA